MNHIKFTLLFCCAFITSHALAFFQQTETLDVLSYHLSIEPDLTNKSIKGTSTIIFQTAARASSITLQSGNLIVDKVTGINVLGYKQQESKLIIELSKRDKRENKIEVEYHGNPTKGLLFNVDLGQAHTVYFTNHWMVCHDIPSDKATLSLDILVPKGKQCVASGTLINIEEINDKTRFKWNQAYESPTYTYGFAIGTFNEESKEIRDTQFNYYSHNLDANNLKKVFQETANMLKFFEEVSGIKYPQETYSQILIGSHYQEMSGFSVLKETYGKLVLEDSTETNLISHELAHQWWGNQVTCENWNHFWLNEAFATFLSAAYNESRFGEAKYDSDINAYFKVYDDIKERGNDKPLVFNDWIKPSRDDRNIVYFKGAYVLHLLRQELGDKAFWLGIKAYTQQYFGKSVRTIDFQNAMEESSNRSLSAFFDEWVY